MSESGKRSFEESSKTHVYSNTDVEELKFGDRDVEEKLLKLGLLIKMDELTFCGQFVPHIFNSAGNDDLNHTARAFMNVRVFQGKTLTS